MSEMGKFRERFPERVFADKRKSNRVKIKTSEIEWHQNTQNTQIWRYQNNEVMYVKYNSNIIMIRIALDPTRHSINNKRTK